MSDISNPDPDLSVPGSYSTRPLVSVPTRSEFEGFVGMTLVFADCYPEALARIEADQTRHGLEKKQCRLADKLHREALTADFPGFEVETSMPPKGTATAATELAEGRPRMHPLILFVFLFIRGQIGEPKSAMCRILLAESKTLGLIYEQYRITPPGLSTICDNLNTISEETLDFCLQCQLNYSAKNELDDFDTIRADSTSTQANAVFPTESELIKVFLERALTGFKNLMKIGLINLTTRVAFTEAVAVVKEVAKFSQTICLVTGKKGASEKRKDNYNKIYTRIGRIEKRLTGLLAKAQEVFESEKETILPSVRDRIKNIIDQIQSDLENAGTIGEYSSRRINHDAVVETHLKILSICDPSASMIIKGDRDVVFGYRPQIAFSGQGLITAILIPEGNAADSGQLENILNEVYINTRVIASKVTVDDGYANNPIRKWYIELAKEKGVGDVVFSVAGSKGKKALGEEVFYSDEYKEARKDRSAAESGIYTLKSNHEFGSNKRRGIQAVREEHKAKALAYNNRKIIQLIKAKQKREAEKIAADRAKAQALPAAQANVA